jgi:hypothetical protein
VFFREAKGTINSQIISKYVTQSGILTPLFNKINFLFGITLNLFIPLTLNRISRLNIGKDLQEAKGSWMLWLS